MEGKGRKTVTGRVITYQVSFMRWRRKVELINASDISYSSISPCSSSQLQVLMRVIDEQLR